MYVQKPELFKTKTVLFMFPVNFSIAIMHPRPKQTIHNFVVLLMRHIFCCVHYSGGFYMSIPLGVAFLYLKLTFVTNLCIDSDRSMGCMPVKM